MSVPICNTVDKVETFNQYTFTSSNYILPPVEELPMPSVQLSNISVSQTDMLEALNNSIKTKITHQSKVSKVLESM